MRTRMDYTIHVEVEIIELLAIRIRLGAVHRDFFTFDLPWSFLNHRGYDFRVLRAQPPIGEVSINLYWTTEGFSCLNRAGTPMLI